MSTKLVTIVLFLCMCSVAFGAVGMSFRSVHPDHPRQCWDAKTNSVYSVGVNYPRGECKRVICGSDYSMLTFTCDKTSVLSGSDYRFAPFRVSKQFPDCCPN